MQHKLVYKGIYGEQSIDLVRNLVNIDTIETMFGRHNYQIKPHIHHDLFQIFLLEEGIFNLLYEDKEFIINSPCYFTVPKNVSHGFITNKAAKGWVISVSDLALEKTLALDPEVFFEIDEINIGSFNFEDAFLTNLYQTIHKLINEYNSNLPARNLAIEFLVGMMLIRLFRIPKDVKTILRKFDNSYSLYFRRFKHLVKEHVSFDVPLDYYAEKLAISVGHLNRICNEIAGKSPRKIINEYIIFLAKSMLGNFDLNINEIAFNLGFQDPSYFTRLFRQIQGISPRNYRKLLSVS